MDYEKIIDALKTIKEVCEESPCCKKCILSADDNNHCIIEKITPGDWEIKNAEEIEQIKIFK